MNRSLFYIGILILTIFVLVSCGDSQSDDVPTAANVPSVDSFIEDGWINYSEGDYEVALEDFDNACRYNSMTIEAYVGKAWSYLRLGDYSGALSQFSYIITLATDPLLVSDAYAGIALSYSLRRNVLEVAGETPIEDLEADALLAIEYGNQVIAAVGGEYSSDHDPDFTSDDIHLLLIQNYFYLKEYESVKDQMDILEPGFVDSVITQLGLSTATDTLELDPEVGMTITTNNWGIYEVSDLFIMPVDTLDYNYDYIQGDQTININLDPEPTGELMFVVKYSYIANFVEYLYSIMDKMQELTETL